MRTLHLSLLIVPFLAACTTQTQEPKLKVTGMYSDMRYNDEGGDVLGTEIFVLNTKQGYRVVFQTAEGEPSVPTVLKATVTGDKIAFALPAESDPRGEFRGTISQGELAGVFLGNDQHVRLRRKNSYWQ